MTTVCSPVPREVWREVQAADPASLPEHRPEWVDAICAAGQFSDASRLYSFPDGRRFVLPLVRRNGAQGVGGWYMSPPPAWGIGGLIGDGLDSNVVHEVVDDLRSLRAVRVSIRPDPMSAPAWGATVGTDVTVLPRYGHVLELDGDIDAIEARCSKGTRNGCRKARKLGVTVDVRRDGALLDVHYELYERSVARWAEHQHEPLQLALWRARRRDPLSKLRAIAVAMGNDFRHLVAYHDGQAVASSILLLGSTAHETRSAMDRELAAPVRASDLLQISAIKEAVDAGCARYHLGESGPSASLAAFKEKFGAVGHRYAEYRIERLPVTRMDLGVRTAVKRVIGFRDA